MTVEPGENKLESEDVFAIAALLAVDPSGLGGVIVGARAGPVRDTWINYLCKLLPAGSPVRKIHPNIADDRLIGGLDLPATLAAGRPIAGCGVLASSDGGIVLLTSAERLGHDTIAKINGAVDTGQVAMERDGIRLQISSKFGIVALDEGEATDEPVADALADRLAFRVDLDGYRDTLKSNCPISADDIGKARALLSSVTAGDDTIEALAVASLSLGVASPRSLVLAFRCARVAAALAGRCEIGEEDLILASRLILAPRATVIPPDDMDQDAQSQPQSSSGDVMGNDADQSGEEKSLGDIVVSSVTSALSSDVLGRFSADDMRLRSKLGQGKAGPVQKALRGRTVGVAAGERLNARRINIIETIKAAAPWQRFRRMTDGDDLADGTAGFFPLCIRRSDFRYNRYKNHTGKAVIFVVDASGSSAMSRMAEAKGAVETLLSDCYSKRNQVALISFRGDNAETLLPPTRALARARRCLADLPGGGGTPLAAALRGAAGLAESVRRKGLSPSLVLMTDGRANVALDGAPNKGRAVEDAMREAATLHTLQLQCLFVDTARTPQQRSQEIARAIGADYLPLPSNAPDELSTAVWQSGMLAS